MAIPRKVDILLSIQTSLINNQLHILGIAGSMRQDSYSTQVLKMVLKEAKKYKTDTQILELRQVNLPLYNPSASYGNGNGINESVML